MEILFVLNLTRNLVTLFPIKITFTWDNCVSRFTYLPRFLFMDITGMCEHHFCGRRSPSSDSRCPDDGNATSTWESILGG